jgi:hypothetical protein
MPDPPGKSHDDFFKTLSSLAALQRPGAGLFLSLFRLLGKDLIIQTTPIGQFHYFDCPYLLVWLCMFFV